MLILFAISLSELKKYLTNSRLYLCCIYYWLVIKKGSSSSGVGRCTKCLRRNGKLGLVIMIMDVGGSRRYKRVTLTAGGWFSSNYLLLVWIQSDWLLSHCKIKFNNGGQYWTELNVLTTYDHQLSGKWTFIRAQWELRVFFFWTIRKDLAWIWTFPLCYLTVGDRAVIKKVNNNIQFFHFAKL